MGRPIELEGTRCAPRRAWASRSPTRRPRPRSCCAAPTWRCTGPSRSGDAAWRSTTPTTTRARATTWTSSRSCAERVDRDEFTLHYQPIIDLHTGDDGRASRRCCAGSTPNAGCSDPDAFLEARPSRRGCSARSASRRCAVPARTSPRSDPDRVPHELPSVSVNLSSSELADRRVVERVAAALAGLRAPAGAPHRRDHRGRDRRRGRARHDRPALRASACTWRSTTSAPATRRCASSAPTPPTVLKIDKSFVDRLEDDPVPSRSRPRSSDWRATSGLTTVAEGVETAGAGRGADPHGVRPGTGMVVRPGDALRRARRWCATQLPTRRYGDSRESVASASSMMRASSSATGGRSSIAPTT